MDETAIDSSYQNTLRPVLEKAMGQITFNDVIHFLYVLKLERFFTLMCYGLATTFLVLGIFSIVYVYRLLVRDTGKFCSSKCFWPATVQHQVHLLIILLSTTRAAFFFMAPYSWNEETGKVAENRAAFNILDEASSVFFFSLCCILFLFWAELYYISTDSVTTFNDFVRPATVTFNILAYVALIFVLYVQNSTEETMGYYLYSGFTYLAAIIYFISAALFTFYAVVAGIELKSVPIDLESRQQRIRNLQVLAGVCVTALVSRGIIYISITGKNIPTTTAVALIAVTMYYLLLEVLPIAVVQSFYHVENVVDSPAYGKMLLDEDEENDNVLGNALSAPNPPSNYGSTYSGYSMEDIENRPSNPSKPGRQKKGPKNARTASADRRAVSADRGRAASDRGKSRGNRGGSRA